MSLVGATVSLEGVGPGGKSSPPFGGTGTTGAAVLAIVNFTSPVQTTFKVSLFILKANFCASNASLTSAATFEIVSLVIHLLS